MRSPRRIGPAALTGGLTLGLVALGAVNGPVAGAAEAGCTAGSGIRVVVDLGAFGGGVQVSCVTGDPASGRAALQAAGFAVSDVPRQRGFVCTINANPNPCNGAPDDAYWSYWHAPAGGAWTYSSFGTSNRDPAPGTVEGWAFGSGTPPSVSPPGVDAERAAPAPAPGSTPRKAAPTPAPAAPAPGPARPDEAPAEPGSAGPGTGGERDGSGSAAGPGDSSTSAPRSSDPAATEAPGGSAAAPSSAAQPGGQQSGAPRSGAPSAGAPSAVAPSSGASGAAPSSSGAPSTGLSPLGTDPSAVATSAPATSAAVVDPASASGPTDAGTPTATLVAVGLVALLGVWAGIVGVRRRRSTLR